MSTFELRLAAVERGGNTVMACIVFDDNRREMFHGPLFEQLVVKVDEFYAGVIFASDRVQAKGVGGDTGRDLLLVDGVRVVFTDDRAYVEILRDRREDLHRPLDRLDPAALVAEYDGVAHALRLSYKQ